MHIDFLILGDSGSGKDTVADILCRYSPDLRKSHPIQDVKDFLDNHFGFPLGLTDTQKKKTFLLNIPFNAIVLYEGLIKPHYTHYDSVNKDLVRLSRELTSRWNYMLNKGCTYHDILIDLWVYMIKEHNDEEFSLNYMRKLLSEERKVNYAFTGVRNRNEVDLILKSCDHLVKIIHVTGRGNSLITDVNKDSLVDYCKRFSANFADIDNSSDLLTLKRTLIYRHQNLFPPESLVLTVDNIESLI